MLLYVIEDSEGNFTTQHGYQRDISGKWSYTRYTGRCDGMRYFISQELAQNILDQLIKVKNKLSQNINFNIISIDKYKIPSGKRITSYV